MFTIKYIIILSLSICVSVRCRYNKSFAYVGFSKHEVGKDLEQFTKNQKSIKSYVIGDTMILISEITNSPFEMIFLFKNDTCYYQEFKVFCSPCADKFTKDILEDKVYKFKSIDGTNYVSIANPKIVMRLGTSKRDTTSCNIIKINMSSKAALPAK